MTGLIQVACIISHFLALLFPHCASFLAIYFLENTIGRERVHTTCNNIVNIIVIVQATARECIFVIQTLDHVGRVTSHNPNRQFIPSILTSLLPPPQPSLATFSCLRTGLDVLEGAVLCVCAGRTHFHPARYSCSLLLCHIHVGPRRRSRCRQINKGEARTELSGRTGGERED